MKNIQTVGRYLKRNSSIILSFIGAVGVIGTGVLSVQATPKAMRLLEKAKAEKGEDLTKFEVINTAGPVYIPSIAVGLTTIGCIFGANALNKKQQAALISAYGLLDRSYKEYQNKVKDMLGEDTDQAIQESIAEDKYDDVHVYSNEDNMRLFYEEHYGKYFERTMEEVLSAEMQVNQSFVENGVVTLNEFYEFLDLDPIPGGDLIGWEPDSMIEFYGHSWINFEHQLVKMDDGLECYIVNTQVKPYSVL